jgi:Family of unknown function (DUF5677)
VPREEPGERPAEERDEDEPAGEEQLAAAARDQLARELEARQQVARGCGNALIELASQLEHEDAIVDPAVDPLGVVLLAFAARGGRVLRATYRLLDAGEAPEAVPLLRILSEYAIAAQWLVEHPDRLDAWAFADYQKRNFVIGEVMRELREDDHESRAGLQAQREKLQAGRDRWVGGRGEPAGAVPGIEGMASEIGAGFGYQLAYRTQSQADIHATPLAVDNCYERLPDGRLRLRAVPDHALPGFDQYAIGAVTLLQLLDAVDRHLPALMWRNGLVGVNAALTGAHESDPRKAEDEAGVLLARVAEQGDGEAADAEADT